MARSRKPHEGKAQPEAGRQGHPASGRFQTRSLTISKGSGARDSVGRGSGGRSATKGPRTSGIRRVPESPADRFLHDLQDGWRRALETPWIWIVLFLGTLTWLLVPSDPRRDFAAAQAVPGAISTRDYVAPVDLPVEDEETTAEKRRKAAEDVLPVYDFDSRAAEDAEQRVGAFFELRRQELLPEGEGGIPAPGSEEELSKDAALTRLQEEVGLKLTPEVLDLFEVKGYSLDLEDHLRTALAETFRRGVVSDRSLLLQNRVRGITLVDLGTGVERLHLGLYDHLDYPEGVRASYNSETRRWPGLNGRQRRTLAAFLLDNTVPNLSFNGGETQARRAAAAEEADPVFVQIRKGEVIVRKGDEITPAAARAITALGGGLERGQLLPVLGTLLLLLLGTLVLWLGLRGEKVLGHSRERLFGEELLLLTLSCLGARFGFVLAQALGAVETAPSGATLEYAYAVPFAALALVSRLLFGRGLALVLSLLFALLVGRLAAEAPLELLTYSLGGSLAAIFAIDWFQFKQRLVLARAGLVVGLTNAVLVLILTALASGPPPQPLAVGLDVVCALAGGLLVAAAASFSVPILESMLAVTTDIKLVELSNTNLPLLRRLAFEAPGTFQHSLMVANLAKEGCEAIGADPILAYAGGLYHDIGKVFRPDYFIENQHPGSNRHDKLLPSMSALILISHVKDGLELARRHRLPQVLRDAIAQHHGTRLINFFYNRALERSVGEVVCEDDYRYPGPRPQSKVMGVLMLADGIEAASRTLRSPSAVRIRDLTQKITDDCLRDGQLDETDLTLADLRRLADAFQRVLTNIHHRRVDYPGFSFNGAPGQESTAAQEKAADELLEAAGGRVP